MKIDEEKLSAKQLKPNSCTEHDPETVSKLQAYATSSPNLVLGLMYGCFSNVKNLDKFFDTSNGNSKKTDFFDFMLNALCLLTLAVEEQTDNQSFVKEEHYPWVGSQIGLNLLQNAIIPLVASSLGKHVENDPRLAIEADDMVRCLDLYVIKRMNTENPFIICELAKSWQSFLQKGSQYALECLKNDVGAIMKILPSDPMKLNYFCGVASKEEIEKTLEYQSQIAATRGNDQYAQTREKVLQILRAYSGIMEPEIMQFRLQAGRVVRRKREKYINGKKDFLNSHALVLRSKAIEQPIPEEILEKIEKGSFGQNKGEAGINSLTLEHTKPLSGGGIPNAPNLTIVTRLINYDMNTLVKLQVEAMKMERDQVKSHNGILQITSLGDTFPIVIMRRKRDEIGIPMPYVSELPERILNGPWRTDQERAQIKLGFIDPK